MCIRFNIQSRTESMIGACGHAEELVLAKAAREKLPLGACEIYVAGLYSNGLPYIKTEPVFTCLRCAVQIYNFGVKKIYVPVVDKWVALSAEQALETARAYATGEKKV